jgi:hypothetical protein
MGDESPRPGIAVFHLMFLSALHSAGRLVSLDTPLPSGPRHADQLLLGAAWVESGSNAMIAARQTIKVNIVNVGMRFIMQWLLVE